MAKAPRKPKPKKLTVREARRLGLDADRRRLETEAIVREAEDEAAKELARKRAEAKEAEKAARAEAQRIKRAAAAEERRINKQLAEARKRAGGAVEAVPETVAGKSRGRMARLHELFDSKSEAMMQVMHDIAIDKSVHASVRLDAADRFMNRLYGKPKEHLTVDDQSSGVDANDEVMSLLGNIFEAVGLPPLLEDKSATPPSEGKSAAPPSSEA